MENTRSVILLVILFIVFFAPTSSPPLLPSRDSYADISKEEKRAYGVLLQSQYGDLDSERSKYLNLTGFRMPDNYAWDLLPLVKRRALDLAQSLLGQQASVLNGSFDGLDKALGHEPSELERDLALASLLPFYRNVTGSVDGEWVRSSIETGRRAPVLNFTAISPRRAFSSVVSDRNITGSNGKIHFAFNEKGGLDLKTNGTEVRQITSHMVISDDSSSGEGWEVGLYGVHYPQYGSMVLSTTSQKFWSSYASPQFALTRHLHDHSKALYREFVSEVVGRSEQPIFGEKAIPWFPSKNDVDRLLPPAPHCEFVVYLQQHIIPVEKPQNMRIIEQELRYPSGVPVPVVPEIVMSMIVFSPDCGFVLESKGPPHHFAEESNHLQGSKLEVFLWKTRYYGTFFTLAAIVQTLLLIRQMNDASTPSTTSRVSFYTVAILCLGDGFAFMSFLAVAVLQEAAFLNLATTSFFCFLCVSIFGMKFLMTIWSVQAPERRERAESAARTRPRERATTVPALATAPGELPAPVTSRPHTSDVVILPPDQDIEAAAAEDDAATATTTTPANTANRAESPFALPARFYFFQLFLVFLSLAATGWPPFYRTLYIHGLFFAYASMWVPQIIRNVIRNCRKALRYDFVIGQSLIRIGPLVWVYTLKHNIISLDPSPNAALILSGWIWTQVWILIGQDVLGARFFVPGNWAPPAYDYHPILSDDVESGGAGIPIGFSQAMEEESLTSPTTPEHHVVAGNTAPEKRSKSRKVYDCAICMQDIDLPVTSGSKERGENSPQKADFAATLLARRAYMVTPCRHVFHTPCLEGWMRYRLQCPICRETLPPI